MIQSKDDLKRYLALDKKMLGIPNKRKFPRPFYDETWRFEIALRKAEYASNCCRGGVKILYFFWTKLRFHVLSVKYGFTIPLNVFGAGLSIAHYGTIVVNKYSVVGENCRIQEGVNIGSSGREGAPIIGNNVFIGTGAKIVGPVKIMDDCVIGAGAVVTKSFDEKGITIGGVPARKISDNDSRDYIIQGVSDEGNTY